MFYSSGMEETHNYDYQDDFNSSTTSTKETHSQTSSTSITPTNSYTNIQQDHKHTEKEASADNQGFALSPLRSASLASNQSDNDIRLGTSMKSMTAAHPRDKNQHSSFDSHKAHIRVGQRALARLPPAPELGESFIEPKGFSLSPIHSQVMTKGSVDLSASGQSLVSSSSEPDRKGRGVSLTPIHSTSITHIKDIHYSKEDDGLLKRATLHQPPEHLVLSPLHQRDNSVNTTGPVNTAPDRNHSTAGTQLSPMRKKSDIITLQDERDQKQHSPTRRSIPSTASTIQQSTPSTIAQQPGNELTRPQHLGNTSVLSTAVQQPSSTTSKVTASHGIDSVMLAKTSIESDSTTKKDDNVVNIQEANDTFTAQGLLTHNQSGLASDLAELQRALQAAGLPGIETSPARGGNTAKNHHPDLTELQPVSDSVDNHQSSLHCTKTDTRQTVQREASSERKVSTHHPSVGSVNLKEAIRAIASEEITMISKELLQRDRQTKQSSTKEEHLSADIDKPPHENADSATTNYRIPDIKDSHFQGLEEFDQLMAEVSDTRHLETQTSDKPGVSLKDASDNQNGKKVETSTIQNVKKKPSASQSRITTKPASKLNSRNVSLGKKQTSSSRPLPASSRKKQPLKTQTKENRNPSTLRTKSQPLKCSSTSKSEQSLTGGDRSKKTEQPGLSLKKDEDNRSLHLHVTMPSSQTPPTGDSPCSFSSYSDSQDESHLVNDNQLSTVQSEKVYMCVCVYIHTVHAFVCVCCIHMFMFTVVRVGPGEKTG